MRSSPQALPSSETILRPQPVDVEVLTDLHTGGGVAGAGPNGVRLPTPAGFKRSTSTCSQLSINFTLEFTYQFTPKVRMFCSPPRMALAVAAVSARPS